MNISNLKWYKRYCIKYCVVNWKWFKLCKWEKMIILGKKILVYNIIVFWFGSDSFFCLCCCNYVSGFFWLVVGGWLGNWSVIGILFLFMYWRIERERDGYYNIWIEFFFFFYNDRKISFIIYIIILRWYGC